MLRNKNRLVIMLLVTVVVCSSFVSAQNVSINQWVDLLGNDNATAHQELVDMGEEALPALQNALDVKWEFHAYIPQRTKVTQVLADMESLATIPALKSALIMEPQVRLVAVDAVVALQDKGLSMGDFLAELMLDPVDYQLAQIEILKDLYAEEADVIEILTGMADAIVVGNGHNDPVILDKMAEFMAHFIMQEKEVVEPPKPITREAIMAALKAQKEQAASGKPAEPEEAKIDLNELIFTMLQEQVIHSDAGHRTLALRVIGRLADLSRAYGRQQELKVNEFVPVLLTALQNKSELMGNRVLAVQALELIVPANSDTITAIVAVLAESGTDRELKLSAVRTLEHAGTALGDQALALLALVPELEPAMQWRLAGAFVFIGKNDPAVVKQLEEFAANPELQHFALQILGTIDPAHPQVVAKAAAKPVAPATLNAERVRAFPGAEGRGAYASGGRGGEVYMVTNLNNAGPGSLRDAVSRPNRTVVFAVSGTIELGSQLKTAANITLAGQTAPGDGIAVSDMPFFVGGSNSIVRYMRFRLGDRGGSSSDAVNIDRNIDTVILDHLSMSWGVDEVFSSYNNTDTTVQYSMIGEGLNWRNHSAVGLWGPRASYHHNLIYSNKTRHPKLAYLGDIVEFNNNVIYNWKERSIYTGSQGMINFIGNYLKPGPSTNSGVRGMLIQPEGDNVKIFIQDNILEGNVAINENNWVGVTGAASRMSEPYSFEPITLHTAEEAYDIVLKHAGASFPSRDIADERIINDIKNGTGDIIIRQAEVGGFPVLDSHLAPVDSDGDGMPDMWEIYHGLDPFDAKDRNYDLNGDGYTNLENYINGLLEEHVLWP